MAVWTHGRWTVKEGREDDLVAALRRLAREARDELGAPVPTLLRSREQPNLFLTFGRWDSLDEIERFRAFAMPRIGELRELLDDLEIHTLDEEGIDG